MEEQPTTVSGSFLITLIVALAALGLGGFSAMNAKKVTALEMRLQGLEVLASQQAEAAAGEAAAGAVVTAQRVSLTDAAGVERGALFVDASGAMVVSLLAEDGQERLRLSAQRAAAGMVVRDDNGTGRLDAGWRYDEEAGGRAAVGAHDRTGALRVELGVGEGVPAVTLYNEAGVPVEGAP